MPRKLRFYRIKNQERKRKTMTVSIPLHLLHTPPTFSVHLPISSYLNAPVSNLRHLGRRRDRQSLPTGWIEHVDARRNNSLVFSRLISSQFLLETDTFIVRINHDLSWTLSCHGIRVDTKQCRALTTTPQWITCIFDVIDILSVVQTSRICCGNIKPTPGFSADVAV